MNDNKMFQEKTLIIPDYVLVGDIDIIHNWFEKYDIASVEKVTFHLHEEAEYYDESYKDSYGYAVIEINHWYTNSGACTFYDNICHKECKMVFDDPCYWDVEFYDYNQYNTYNHNDDIASPRECLENEYDIAIKEDVYESTDDEPDYTYECKIYRNIDKKSSLGKKQRTRYTEEEVDRVLVVINKNYKKRARQKEFKNVWARRLARKYCPYMY